MEKNDYSRDLAKRINGFLNNDNWNFRFDEEKGCFFFKLNLEKTRLRAVDFEIDVRKDDFIVYGISPISADQNDPGMISRMAEFLHRVNYGTVNGNFELDYRDGEVRYKSFVDCENSDPSDDVIRNSIYFTGSSLDKYGDGILNMIFTDMSPEEAYDRCTKAFLEGLLARYSNDEESADTDDEDDDGDDYIDGDDIFDDIDDDDVV